ncbi:MAG: hypothetical protein IT447_03595 [Phycisphaerales bacterium]|jgi:predicted nucleotidyltransferase|nr:hypothetical protein [Phycisphaerales bacterium]
MTDFRQLLRVLQDAHVEFILIGGMAAIAHGAARLTQDLDVVYRRTDENIARLASALKDHSPYLRDAPPGLPFQWDDRTIRRGLNFTLKTTFGDIDLFGEIIGGGGYEQLLPHTIILRIFEMDCRCIDLVHLIQVKRAAGRPRDLDAVAELEALLDENRES